MSADTGLGLAIIKNIQQAISQHAAELTQLDSAIGDGDHGSNLKRGFDAVLAKVQDQPDQSLAAVIKTTAMTLISTVGGAAGPLYGTAFLRAATAIDGSSNLNADAAVEALDAAIEGIKTRGKATTGEKTMLDALVPAADALQAAVGNGASLTDAMAQAADAARGGAQATIPMQATKGRASYLGERSVGHQDPGATSSALIIAAISEAIDKACSDESQAG